MNLPECRIRSAGPGLRAVFNMLGVDGLTMPWRTVYLRPGCENDRPLVVHELVHIKQIDRYGPVLFALLYIWYLVRFGYWQSPLEIEARKYQRLAHLFPRISS